MEKARCTQDNSIYRADQFADLPKDAFLSMRQNLVCPECARRAFFRGQSQDGRDPHFGARPHAEGCQQRATQATGSTRERGGSDADFLASSQEIAVDLSFDSPASWGEKFDSVDDDSDTMADGLDDSGANLNQARSSEMPVRRMGLRALLRLLLSRPEFNHSEKVLRFPGLGRARACDFFVALQDISTRHERHTLGMFGRIMGAQYSSRYDCVWLYSEGLNTPNIQITMPIASFLLYRYEIADISMLAGAYVLVIGKVLVSSIGTRYVNLDDPRYIAVDSGRDL